MSTHNICFYGELEKIIPEQSSNTFPSHVLCSYFFLKRYCGYSNIKKCLAEQLLMSVHNNVLWRNKKKISVFG